MRLGSIEPDADKPKSAMSGFTNISDLLTAATRRDPTRALFSVRAGTERVELTRADVRGRVEAIAAGLLRLGIAPGDRVGIVSDTGPNWVLADLGIALAGAVSVPIFPAYHPDTMHYIMDHASIKLAFVETVAQLEEISARREDLPHLSHLILMATEKPVSGETEPVESTLEDVIERNPTLGEGFLWTLSALEEIGTPGSFPKIRTGQLASVVYTPGTTGPPKGVMLTQEAMLFVSDTMVRALQWQKHDRVLIFLPLAHILPRMIVLSAIRSGALLIFGAPDEELIHELGVLRPTVIPGVPLVYEGLKRRIEEAAREATGIRGTLFRWALTVAKETAAQQKVQGDLGMLGDVRYRLARRIGRGHIHDLLGGDIRQLLSGGSALNSTTIEWFHALELPLLEAYGLTETCGVSHVNREGQTELGTVGVPFQDVEVRIADDQEVLIRGPNVMRGYYEDPEATREALLDNGWLRTGDTGQVTDTGFLRITGRKKALIVTAEGKNIAPRPIEVKLQSSPYISQAFVYGDDRSFLTALFTLNSDIVQDWAMGEGLSFSDQKELCELPEIHALTQSVVDDVNRSLPAYEAVQKFAILPVDFSPEDGSLNPTMQIRRRAIEEQNQALLDSFYTDSY